MRAKGYIKNCVMIAALIYLSSCTTIGPRTIIRDRLDYTTVLSDSWKDQMLLNIVRIRYGDAPIFLDVASVISSYELSGRALLNGNFNISPDKGLGGETGIDGFYANRPTITYIPLSGEKMARSLLSPIPVLSILNIIQSGYRADFVIRAFIQSINGLENRYVGRRPADAAFFEITKRMQRIQDAGAIGLQFGKLKEGEIPMIVFRDKNNKEVDADIAEVKKILGLHPETREFMTVYGAFHTNDKEIAILSRSMVQVLNNLAYYMEVPPSDLTENRTNPGFKSQGEENETPLIRILCSPQRPDDAFVAVPYQKQWFWIDNKDLFSKQVLSFLMFCFALEETGDKEGTPVVTVPVR